MVLMGFDKQCITPAASVALSGYAGARMSDGVHDDLFVRCMVLEFHGVLYVLAQCDCIAVDDALRFAVLENLPQFPLCMEHFVLSATHTHSGPAGTIDTSVKPFASLQGVFGLPNPAYQKDLAKKIALAITNAFSNRTSCNLTVASGTVTGVGSERHDPALPGDPSLFVLRFDRTDGKKVLLYNYACHPTVLNPTNLLITADFPYAVEQSLPYDMTMFVNSNAGDISTRFTRSSSSYEQAEAYGNIICESISDALAEPLYTGTFDYMDIKEYPISLPVKKLPCKEVLEKQLDLYEAQLTQGQLAALAPKELRVLASYVEGAKVSLDLGTALEGLNDIETHFSVITLQDFKIATIPGELFSTLGLKLKQQGIQVFGYTNGYYLYLADETAYDQMYYEAMSSPFVRGVGEALVQEILKKVLL